MNGELAFRILRTHLFAKEIMVASLHQELLGDLVNEQLVLLLYVVLDVLDRTLNTRFLLSEPSLE